MVSKRVHHGSLLPKEGHFLRLSLQMVDRDLSREPTHGRRMPHQSAAGGGQSGTERDELVARSCVHPKSKDTGFSLLKLTSNTNG